MTVANHRVYAYYRSLRDSRRGLYFGEELECSQEPTGTSYFNHCVEECAKKFSLSFDAVRQAIYEAHAKKHGVTLEEAEAHFLLHREWRVERHAKQEEERALYSEC